MHTLRGVFVGSPPPGPEVVLTNFFAEPAVLLVPIASRAIILLNILVKGDTINGALTFRIVGPMLRTGGLAP